MTRLKWSTRSPGCKKIGSFCFCGGPCGPKDGPRHCSELESLSLCLSGSQLKYFDFWDSLLSGTVVPFNIAVLGCWPVANQQTPPSSLLILVAKLEPEGKMANILSR